MPPQGQQLNHAFGSRLKRRLLLTCAALVLGLSGVLAFGVAPDTPVYAGDIAEIREPLSLSDVSIIVPEVGVHTREVRIRRGDTMSELLTEMSIQDAEVHAFLNRSRETDAIFRQLAPGKTISAQVNGDGSLAALHFPLSGERDTALQIVRGPDGLGVAVQELENDVFVKMQSAEIRHSLFGAADDAGIPDSVAIALADIFGGDIDFHRDLRRGDKFSVIYEVASHGGRALGYRILAAEFINDGRTHRAFRFDGQDGKGGYYTADGRSVKKAFLRSPLEFSRISSGFSHARLHPVLGTMRAHRGIDYAAPTGTKVRATGDGIVDFAGVQGGYGKVVIVRHTGNKTTLYAHLSGFAPGIKKGSRVTQGETIGFVGASGLASGPHLHYEFRVAGVHRDPLTIASPAAAPLSPSQLPKFLAQVEDLTTRIDLIRGQRFVLLD